MTRGNNAGTPYHRTSSMITELDGIAVRLSKLRVALGLPTAGAAFEALSGAKGTTWQGWETGVTYPSVRHLALMRHRWNINLNWLILGEGQPFEGEA